MDHGGAWNMKKWRVLVLTEPMFFEAAWSAAQRFADGGHRTQLVDEKGCLGEPFTPRHCAKERGELARAYAQAAIRPATMAAEFHVSKEEIVDALASALLPFIK